MAQHFLNRLQSAFSQNSRATALVVPGKETTFGQLESLAQKSAGWLQAQGLSAGERVVLCTSHKLPLLVAHLGVQWAGGVSLPLNPGFKADELRWFLADSGAALAIVGPEQAKTFLDLQPNLPQLRAVLTVSPDWEPPAAKFRQVDVAAEDPSLILYSSGTTGRPKGVVHTHANLAASLAALAECWRITPHDRILNVLPLFHIHGLSFATHLSLVTGSTLMMEEAFHPRRTLEAIGRSTVFMAIPTFYYAFLERPEFREAAKNWSHVRLFTCGSAPIRAEVLPELEGILGRPVINRYGMTEGHVLTSLPLNGPWPGGSVGLPLSGIELSIVRDDGAPAGPGEVGQVRVRGPNLFREYWRNPQATEAAFIDGWFDTGDLGLRDAAGFLTLVGRKHDLIITSGFNVYPQVVERAINECPGVADSAVLGLTDAKRGERVAAAVVRSDAGLDETRLREFLKSRLVDYQRPHKIVFVERLPRNALGKVLRRELRELFTGEC
jgi:malonyl-CoA/methylmalonyl-CoA synthetase